MKSVLAIYFSQTGQLAQIIKSFTSKYEGYGIQVEYISIEMVKKFPFPWNDKSFFGTMTDSVLGKALELIPIVYKKKKYDFIILGYQPWFLSPSIPINSLLNDASFKKVAENTPVIAITGARNMWVKAFERIKLKLDSIKATLVGNIVLVDRNNNYVSLFTIIHWLYGGRKDRLWSLFPLPGVSQNDISKASEYGEIVAKNISESQSFIGLQDKLVGAGAVKIKSHLLFMEKAGTKMFRLWAQFIDSKKNKNRWLIVFKYYLFVVLLVFSPIILILYLTFVVPFSKRKIKEESRYYSCDII